MKIKTSGAFAIALASLATTGTAMAGELTANAGVTNNYIWRGLSQSENGAAVSGGLDYVTDSGFYAGTWVSNVSYGANDRFSFEHDLYAGIRGGDVLTWDVGYLYYNYDKGADFDFSEAYVAVGFKGFTLKYSALVQSGRSESLDEGAEGLGTGLDYGFDKSSYASLDYAYALPSEVTLGFHVGTHEGDFARSFNGFNTKRYWDYNISIAKAGFKFMVSDTNLNDDKQMSWITFNNNGEPKYVISYTHTFEL
jgi:uncharacterized protein (TIGR02001 family)